MLVEARRYRRATQAFLANGGTMAMLRGTTDCSHRELRRFLGGELGFLTQSKARKLEQLFSKPVRRWLRESPRYPVSVGQIPTSLVRGLIEESYAKVGREATALTAGMPQRQLFGITRQRQAVYFDIADQIVIRLASPTWWYDDSERQKWLWSYNAVLGRFRAGEAAPRKVEDRSASDRPRDGTSRRAARADRLTYAHNG